MILVVLTKSSDEDIQIIILYVGPTLMNANLVTSDFYRSMQTSGVCVTEHKMWASPNDSDSTTVRLRPFFFTLDLVLLFCPFIGAEP